MLVVRVHFPGTLLLLLFVSDTMNQSQIPWMHQHTWPLKLILLLLSHSNHVLTEDIIFREVTPTNCLISRRLLTKTSRAPRWMERYLPKHMASSAYIIEDSIVDPKKRTMTTLTWNISHARLMVRLIVSFRKHSTLYQVHTWPHIGFVCFCFLPQSVEERCIYQINPDNSGWTEIKREAWISSNVCGLSRAIQVSRVKWSTTVHNTQPTWCGVSERDACLSFCNW